MHGAGRRRAYALVHHARAYRRRCERDHDRGAARPPDAVRAPTRFNAASARRGRSCGRAGGARRRHGRFDTHAGNLAAAARTRRSRRRFARGGTDPHREVEAGTRRCGSSSRRILDQAGPPESWAAPACRRARARGRPCSPPISRTEMLTPPRSPLPHARVRDRPHPRSATGCPRRGPGDSRADGISYQGKRTRSMRRHLAQARVLRATPASCARAAARPDEAVRDCSAARVSGRH